MEELGNGVAWMGAMDQRGSRARWMGVIWTRSATWHKGGWGSMGELGNEVVTTLGHCHTDELGQGPRDKLGHGAARMSLGPAWPPLPRRGDDGRPPLLRRSSGAQTNK